MVAKLGVDELKDALLTLHPQPAMERLHARFREAGGAGSDGAIAFEATEIAATSRARTLVPVRPSEPLAGAPERSPIPLADNVQAAGAAVSGAATNARAAAGGAFDRLIAGAQDLLPRRKPAYRRVTPLASKRETQRRAAVAALALITVVGGLGLGVYIFGGAETPDAISSLNVGQAALDTARESLDRVSGPGIDLVEDDPETALELLTEAYEALDEAEAADVGAQVLAPLRAEVVAGLDRLYGVVPVASSELFTFVPEEGAPDYDLVSMVRGPDGAPYVLDAATKTIFRVDVQRGVAVAVVREGRNSAGKIVEEPRLMATGGRDLLFLDSGSVMWRWRPSNNEGKGTLNEMLVEGSTEWGDDISGIGTHARDVERGLYNLYVIDPSEEQILVYQPASDGGGFPREPAGWLTTAQDVSGMSSMYIDGDIFLTNDGTLERYTSGANDGWEASLPEDTLLRPIPVLESAAGAGERREGRVYAFDPESERVLAFEKGDGTFIEQYRIAGGGDDWSDLRSMYILPGAEDQPATMIWLSTSALGQVFLEAVPDEPGATPRPTAEPDASAEPSTDPAEESAAP